MGDLSFKPCASPASGASAFRQPCSAAPWAKTTQAFEPSGTVASAETRISLVTAIERFVNEIIGEID
jgi:hypothetical protein